MQIFVYPYTALISLLETTGHATPTNFAQHLVQWRDHGFVGLEDSGGTGMGMSTKAVMSKHTFLLSNATPR
ncbi:hypothetical protein EON65_20795 [archaeon]|nr:MAG: hypothetical protein EON65_20795 [archaeon]